MRGDIESLLETLEPTLGVRRRVPRKKLRELYDKGDHIGIANFVQQSMGLDTKLVFARTYRAPNSIPKSSVAWVMLPDTMPPFGTKEFREMTFTVYVRDSFMNRATFEEFVSVVAHELSHIVLDSIGHVLKRHEPAVDLAAMVLGYAEFYEDAATLSYRPAYYASPFERRWWKRYVARYVSLFVPLEQLSMKHYLSREEVDKAAKWIRQNRR